MQTPDEPAIRRQLAKIFASARFKESRRSKKFLEFIVNEALSGNRAHLKENVVGVSVFDRSPDYDPRLDSIVRVEAGRLRAKLAEYYTEEGRDDPIDIQLPKGAYAPEFSWRTPDANDAPAEMKPNPRRWISERRWLIAVVAFTIVSAAVVLIGRTDRSDAPEARVAVLPFTPYASDENAKEIAARLTQKVTVEFVKLAQFDVVPSTTARRYEDRRPGVHEIAAALHADFVLEARISTAGKTVRAEIRLSDGVRDRKFWVGDRFVGEDVDELSRQISLAASAAIAKQIEKQRTKATVE